VLSYEINEIERIWTDGIAANSSAQKVHSAWRKKPGEISTSSDTGWRGHALAMSCHGFFSMSFSELEANILNPTPRLGTVLSFASQIQGDLSFQIGYIYHYSWYPWYILISAVSISATFFKHQTSRGVQLSGGKPMPRRVIQRGEFTAANSGLKKMGGRWPGTPMTPESIDGIRMYTVYV